MTVFASVLRPRRSPACSSISVPGLRQAQVPLLVRAVQDRVDVRAVLGEQRLQARVDRLEVALGHAARARCPAGW